MAIGLGIFFYGVKRVEVFAQTTAKFYALWLYVIAIIFVSLSLAGLARQVANIDVPSMWWIRLLLAGCTRSCGLGLLHGTKDKPNKTISFAAIPSKADLHQTVLGAFLLFLSAPLLLKFWVFRLHSILLFNLLV